MKTGVRTLLAYLFAAVALGCIVVGIVSEVLDKEIGLESNSWLLIAIGIFVLAAWLAILELRARQKS